MRVALDAHATPRASEGMRVYTQALIDHMPRVAPDIELIVVDVPAVVAPLQLRAARADLVHLPYLESPPFTPRPYVAMLHDCIHLRYPASFSRLTAAYWRLFALPMYRGAARVLVSDPRVAADAATLAGIDPERIRVVPLGYDDAIPDAQAWVDEHPYVLYAGNRRSHKNLETLYAAWAALPPEVVVDLVLTGPDDPEVRARFVRPRGRIMFLGHLDAQTLAQRYRGAVAYVQPSLSEGFGIPSLEAAVAGTPVIATTTSVPAIVAPYVRTFEPGDVLTLASLLNAVIADPLSARARAAEGAMILRAYTWDRFAASTAAVYREVLCP
jgi:glycosyltransferase involved in cell wall biosynthesis